MLANKYHRGQMRKYTNEPYIVHPIGVAELTYAITEGQASEDMIAAALLHDTLEDTALSQTEIKALCGYKVLEYVVGLTAVSKSEDGNRKARKKLDREFLWKQSRAVQTIKCADIVDNNSTIEAYDPDFAKIYKAECLELVLGFPEDLTGRKLAISILEGR